MGVVPVGALGLAVGERIEIVLVATDRIVVIRGDVWCAFRIQVEQHEILMWLWRDMETVEVKVRDIIAMEAGRHGHRHQRKLVRVTLFMQLHVNRGTEITNGVTLMPYAVDGEFVDERHRKYIPIRLV